MNGDLKVDVVEDDEWSIPAPLKRHPLYVIGTLASEELLGLGRAREAELANQRVRGSLLRACREEIGGDGRHGWTIPRRRPTESMIDRRTFGRRLSTSTRGTVLEVEPVFVRRSCSMSSCPCARTIVLAGRAQLAEG